VTRREWAGLLAALVVIGAGWGVTSPLSKIAVSTGYRPLGLIFWQLAIAAVVLGAICAATGRDLRATGLQLRWAVLIALIGTLIPNSASYAAYTQLPAGVMSILLSLIPMLAFPIALALRMDRFSPARFAGLALGLAAVWLLIGPEASLPDAGMALFIPLGLIAPLCYAFEGNMVAKWGTARLDPVQLLFWASLTGAVLALPLAWGSGQWIAPRWPLGAPEWALVGSSLVHALVYTGYVWLVGRAGSVFAVQVSYLVTGFGMIWAMLILGERYSPHIWAALALMLLGLFLVQPRRVGPLAPARGIGNTGAD
jgi:drug/metabolite transporter (DMT)-like permease